ncbi:tRNA 2-thiocytidine biosynthesis TtcA family protein [Christensenellaceae bacterium OttesenSCG-928-M15]|nr:tRNA 2-thiocytidine biosynthesis TtcA family protein [Christensenellaceae bacterium OttesenSCG-928-M15]
MKRVLGCIRRADERYHMLKDGDRICVGVSGGKDSMLLMEGLMLYQQFSKTKFTLQAVMLDLGLTKADTTQTEAFAKKIGVPLDVRRTDIGEVVFNIRKETHPCALCAKLRRGALNNAALEHGCNKVALGHNREDVLETFFLSLLYEARINTFAPITYLSRKDVTLIRPFVFLSEKYIKGVVASRNIPILPANCPVAGKTKREEMKSLIAHLCSIKPDAEERMIDAIADTEKYGLWDRMRLPPM